MIYITGDTHGGFQRFGSKYFPQQTQMGRNDYMIICGDFGGLWDCLLYTSEWFDHAQAVKTGGGPVAFVMYHYGLSYPEAMIRLLGGEQGVVYEASPRKKEPEPKEFALPPAGESMRRVYAYLLKQRFISREVLNTFVSQRLIYESCEKSKDNTKEYHNAVFVGFDEHGVPRHAHKRGVYTHGKSYRGNVSGCDPRYSFHWTGSSDPVSYTHLDVYKRQALISKCVDGLTEYAAELRQKAGDAGKEQISALRRLVDELAGYRQLCWFHPYAGTSHLPRWSGLP